MKGWFSAFVTYVLATFTGLILFITSCLIAGGVFLISFDKGIRSFTARPFNSTILQIPLEGRVVAHTPDVGLLKEIAGRVKLVDLSRLTEVLRAARADNRILGLCIEIKDFHPELVDMYTLKQLLEEFKQSGKPIVCHASYYNPRLLALASVADRIYLDEDGRVYIGGMRWAATFYKGFLDRLKVKVNVYRTGNYKSSVEPYTRTQMSRENRKQLQETAQQLCANLFRTIAVQRQLEEKTLHHFADQLPLMGTSEALAAKLIDAGGDVKQARTACYCLAMERIHTSGKLEAQVALDPSTPTLAISPASDKASASTPSAEEAINSNLEQEKPSSLSLPQPTPADLNPEVETALNAAPEAPSQEFPYIGASEYYEYVDVGHKLRKTDIPKILVLPPKAYIGGEVTQKDVISSEEVGNQLPEAAADEAIRAIVLVIDSPGGKVKATTPVWHAIQEVSKKKPIYAVITNIGASGGYYIACACNKIYAHPDSITGSIGVCAVYFDLHQALATHLKITYDEVSTHRFCTPHSMNKPLEEAIAQKDIQMIYAKFLERVAAHTKQKITELEVVAGGRIWTGQQAYNLGLVDRQGTLYDAIRDIAAEQNIENSYQLVYPTRQLNFISWFAKEIISPIIGRPIAIQEKPIQTIFSVLLALEGAQLYWPYYLLDEGSSKTGSAQVSLLLPSNMAQGRGVPEEV